jgi:Mg-chelatase subunit ChlD
MGKTFETSDGIKLIKSNDHAVFSQGGIKIQREEKPIKGELAKVGFVYLVVDCSGSMSGDKLNQAKKGALNFAKDALAKEYSTGLVEFGSDATHICEPTRDIEMLHKHLQKMETSGSTNMAEAIRLATDKLRDKAGFRVMVIVTDGMPDNAQAALEEAREAKNNRIDIITIGTDDADEEFLKKLASRTELNVMVASNQLEQGIASTVKMLPLYGKERG